MSKDLKGVDHPLDVSELPGWLFRCDYREGWTEQPADADWGDEIRAWLKANAPHMYVASGRRAGLLSKEFFNELSRRRHGRLPRDPEGYEHPDSRGAPYGTPGGQVLLPPGVERLPLAAPKPRVSDSWPDPRRVLDGTWPREQPFRWFQRPGDKPVRFEPGHPAIRNTAVEGKK